MKSIKLLLPTPVYHHSHLTDLLLTELLVEVTLSVPALCSFRITVVAACLLVWGLLQWRHTVLRNFLRSSVHMLCFRKNWDDKVSDKLLEA